VYTETDPLGAIPDLVQNLVSLFVCFSPREALTLTFLVPAYPGCPGKEAIK